MANTNTMTDAIAQKLLAMGIVTLRQNAIMPRFVNRKYETEAGDQFSTIDINVASAVSVNDVAPGPTPPDITGVTPTKVSIACTNWKEAAFFINDREFKEVNQNIMPLQAEECVKALANTVDSAILALYTNVFGWGGTAGTTPFATDLTAFLDADAALNDQLAPVDPRTVVLDSKAVGQAKGLRAVQDASWRNDPMAMRRADLGFILGYEWAMDQNIPRHTAGTASGATTDNAGYAIGVKTITLASAGTGTILTGDVFTIAGDDQTYVVVTGDADVSGGGTVTFEPGLKVAIATSATAITLKASHRVNLAFHRDAFALVSRPFAGSDPLNLGTFRSAIDEVSGLALRVELSREHRRTKVAYDILYGVKCVRPECAARIAGA